MYEGRTRGKRMRYTYDEEYDEDDSEAAGTRRSTRNSGVATPADNRPTTTLSGRQVRSRVGGLYGESLLSGQNTDTRPSPATDASDEPVRASRSGRAGMAGRRIDEDGETSSEGEWDGGDEDEPDEPDEVMEDLDDEEEEDASDGADDSVEEMDPRSLVVTLRYGKGRSPSAQHATAPPVPQASPARQILAEVVIPKPSPQAKAITPQSAATNGYPTPISSANTLNGSTQPTPQRSAPVALPNGLPSSYSGAPMKQSQLPFQPMPQHALKPGMAQQSTPQPTSQTPPQ